jgi:2-amino-4-hydroxy-6-hydroxymethyldihydropteridine diphosphokinase
VPLPEAECAARAHVLKLDLVSMTPIAVEPEPRRYFVGLGANLGDRIGSLKAAVQQLKPWMIEGSLRESSFWESEAIDGPGPDYINAVIRFDCRLAPLALLDVLQGIELAFGRQRSTRNAARTLDLDLLLADDQRIEQDRLQVPHPRMHERAFVLQPLLELDPGLSIPGLGPASEWLGASNDQTCLRLTV